VTRPTPAFHSLRPCNGPPRTSYHQIGPWSSHVTAGIGSVIPNMRPRNERVGPERCRTHCCGFNTCFGMIAGSDVPRLLAERFLSLYVSALAWNSKSNLGIFVSRHRAKPARLVACMAVAISRALSRGIQALRRARREIACGDRHFACTHREGIPLFDEGQSRLNSQHPTSSDRVLTSVRP
jgi:hypothetical protein